MTSPFDAQAKAPVPDTTGRVVADGLPESLVSVEQNERLQARRLAAGAGPAISPADVALRGLPLRGRILVVDDEESVLRGVALPLTESGFDVETAHNGKVAIDRLKARQFDVVVSDISLPGFDGVDLLRAVREHDLDIPVVIMTGTPALSSAIRAVEHGAFRYLVKPVLHSALLPLVDRGVHLCRLARVKRQALTLVGDANQFVGDRVGLDLHFSRALGGIWMAFQPIISWSTKQVYAHEMLMRSTEPRFTSPGALLSAAERLGRLDDLGRAVRSAVARTASEMPDCKLFMNLHACDLNDQELYSKDAPLSKFAGNIVLEITERASLDEIGDVRGKLRQLRAMGYQIALDDLGAGYAGLTSLAQLDPEVVKLDMSLIRDLDMDLARQQLVGAMVKLSKEMGKLVVIEGVETIGERDALVHLGGDLFQGFLFAMPSQTVPVISW